MSNSNPFTESNEKAIYFSVFQGKISMSVKASQAKDEGVITRTNKDGVEVYERHFDAIAGIITKIELKLPPQDKPTFGKQWVITFNKGGLVAKLNMKYDSGYALGFLKRLPNIDFNKEVKLRPSFFIPEGKTKEGAFMSVYNGGNKVEPYFTKDNPNGLPQLEEVVFKGEKQWDNSKQMAYFETVVEAANTKIKSLLPDGDIQPSGDGNATISSSVPQNNNTSEVEDDLPF